MNYITWRKLSHDKRSVSPEVFMREEMLKNKIIMSFQPLGANKGLLADKVIVIRLVVLTWVWQCTRAPWLGHPTLKAMWAAIAGEEKQKLE
jgi:hypothetical protein